MRRPALLAAALLAAVMATGCEALPPTPPDWVVSRVPLPSCGTAQDWGQASLDARRCLLEAYRDGRDAELISNEGTLEGDPITRIHRVHEDGVVEIFTDATQDRFGSGRWERAVCDELISVGQANAHGAAYAEQGVFVAEGCRDEAAS
jgi:hypothetical protein